jgi:hypothetical protein
MNRNGLFQGANKEDDMEENQDNKNIKDLEQIGWYKS